MAKTDMSRKAVTVRIMRTGQLRRLCLQLRKRPKAREDAQPMGRRAPSAK